MVSRLITRVYQYESYLFHNPPDGICSPFSTMQCSGNTIRQLHTELQLFSNSHNLKQYLKRELCSIKIVPKNRWGFPSLLNRHHVFSFKGKRTQARGEREGRESRSFSRSLSRVNMFSCLPCV